MLDYLQRHAKTRSFGDYIGEEHVPGESAFTRVFTSRFPNEKDHEMFWCLVSYLKDEELHFAVQAAAKYDCGETRIVELLSKASSNELKYDLLHGCDSKGNTILKAAKEQKPFVLWFVNEAVKGDDHILIKPNDVQGKNAWIDCKPSYSDILEAVFNRFKPKLKLQHVLMMDFDRDSLLTNRYSIGNRGRKKRDALVKIITSALTELTCDIDDVDTAFPLFRFAVLTTKHAECAKMILSKTTQSIKNELLINHGCKWNVFKTIISNAKGAGDWVRSQLKSMLQMITSEVQNKDIMKAIKDDNGLHFKEQSLFHMCCETDDMWCMDWLLSVYDECKESYNEEWTKSNWNHENPLHLAIKSSNPDLVALILKHIENDTERLRMIMQQTKSGENALQQKILRMA
eukprot:639376_1